MKAFAVTLLLYLQGAFYFVLLFWIISFSEYNSSTLARGGRVKVLVRNLGKLLFPFSPECSTRYSAVVFCLWWMCSGNCALWQLRGLFTIWQLVTQARALLSYSQTCVSNCVFPLCFCIRLLPNSSAFFPRKHWMAFPPPHFSLLDFFIFLCNFFPSLTEIIDTVKKRAETVLVHIRNVEIQASIGREAQTF